MILTWNKKGVLDIRDTDGYLCERDDDDDDDVMIYVFQGPIYHPGWARWEEHGEVLSLSTPFQTHAKKKARANVQPKSSIPIGAKVEISPEGFTLVSQGRTRFFFFSICPKLLINAELDGLVLAPRLEKGYITPWNLGGQFATLGANFQHLLISWHQCSSTY